MPKDLSMSPDRLVEVGGIRRAYRNRDCLPWRGARWPQSTPECVDVLRETLVLPTVVKSGIPGNTMHQRRCERLMLASDRAEAYIGVSSFRTALRKRVRAA